MHSTLSVLLAASALAFAAAKCPNLCSGHGSCSKDDKCLCWNGYTGADCSLRTCAQGQAWALDNASPHRYSECGNRGVCDRSTGACQCFDGYSGAACERVACPNDCSGHGKCRAARDLPNYDPNDQYITNALDWEETHLTACVCDGGFFGPDCSLRKCPHGDDPVTVCDQTDRTEQVQTVTLKSEIDMDTGGSKTSHNHAIFVNDEISFTFKTPQGTNFTTEVINGLNDVHTQTPALTTYDRAGASATDTTSSNVRIEKALEGLPNFAIEDVTVTSDSVTADATGLTRVYSVTFHHEADNQNSYGPQELLGCTVTTPCAGAGCHPKQRQMYVAASLTGKDATAGTSSISAANYKTPAEATSYVRFHEESVLQCPVGGTCAVGDGDLYMAGVAVAVLKPATAAGDNSRNLASGTDTHSVYVRTLTSSADASLLTTDSDWASDSAGVLANGAAAPGAGTFDNDFTYVGELDSSNVAKFDISNLVPNTYLTFASDLNAGNDYYQLIAYDPFRCTVADTTESGSAHKNADAENIECSGRGECNRGTGTCECFSGYTGNSCSSQTVLV